MADEHDAFLSYTRADEAEAWRVAEWLERQDIRAFLLARDVLPGDLWITSLEQAIERSRTIVVLLGRHGRSAWQDEERQLGLVLGAQDHKRVIPTLLPGARPEDIDGFLRLRAHVDLAAHDGWERLLAGISGRPSEQLPGIEPGPELTAWLAKGSRERPSPRAEYLQRVLQFLDEQRPLRSLLAHSGFPAGELKLAEVVVVPRLSSAYSSTEPPPPVDANPSDTGSNQDTPQTQRGSTRLQQRLAPSLIELIWQSQPDRPFKYGVVGDVGSGKSTLLQVTARQLALEALDNPHAPLPILVDAQGLLTSRGYHGAISPDETLLRNSTMPRIFLVDAYDEVDRRKRDECQRTLRDLAMQPSTRGIVVTMRRVHSLPREVDYAWLEIEPWTARDAATYLERCERFVPSAAARAREVVEQHPLFASSPLMLTLVLAFASRAVGTFRTRAELFSQIAELLFSEWSRWRESDEPRWRGLQRDFCRVALRTLRTGRTEITREELCELLAQCGSDGVEELLRLSTEHFGLFVNRGEDTYQFLLRPIAEHLAGEALLDVTEGDPLDAATAGWAEEPLRHMVGLAALRGQESRATTLVCRLLDQAKSCLHNAHRTRCVVVATRAALDLGKSETLVAGRVAKALSELVTNESSTWIPRVARDVIREVATAQGPCWRALRPLLEAEIERFDEEEGDDVADRRWGLFHREPHVRVAAIRSMAVTVADPDVQCLLLRMMGEPLMLDHIFHCPCVEAALVLREAREESSSRLTFSRSCFDASRTTTRQLLEQPRVRSGRGKPTSASSPGVSLCWREPVFGLARSSRSSVATQGAPRRWRQRCLAAKSW